MLFYKNRVKLKKLISFLLSYSLVFNNLLYASSVVLSDYNSETKVYYDNSKIKGEDTEDNSDDNDTIIIDIAKPIRDISLNIFKLFSIESKKVIINNSREKTKSKLINREIEANKNYDDHDNTATTIVFYLPKEVNSSILSSTSFEVLGSVNNFIFTNPNGLILQNVTCHNIERLTLATGDYKDIGINIANINNVNGKISLLPTEDKNHLALDASEINELNILAREIDISGGIIVKGSLAIITGLSNKNKRTTTINLNIHFKHLPLVIYKHLL